MTYRSSSLALASVLVMTTRFATAQSGTEFKIIVDRSSLDGCSGQQTITYYDQSTPLTVGIPSCATRVAILGGHLTNHSDATDNDIPAITLTGGPSNWPLEVVLGVSFVGSDSAPQQAARNWAGLNAAGLVGFSQLSGAIAGDLTGSITGLDSMSRFDVRGAITATATASTEIVVGAPHLSLFVVEAGSFESLDSVKRARVVLSSGTITRIQTNTGNLEGDIVARAVSCLP